MSNDLHERFVSWLLAGAEGDPPRDVALHASLCAECARWIAAHDALRGIDPGRAPLPPSQAPSEAPLGDWRPVARLAAAAASLLVIGGVAALGVSQLLAGLQREPIQEVLSATGTPEATPHAPTAVGGEATASARASQSTPAAGSRLATTRPSLHPTRSASATVTATVHVSPPPTEASTPTPTPASTATPTSVPTPTPSPIETPTPSATPTATPSP